jgi:hypothetical protein
MVVERYDRRIDSVFSDECLEHSLSISGSDLLSFSSPLRALCRDDGWYDQRLRMAIAMSVSHMKVLASQRLKLTCKGIQQERGRSPRNSSAALSGAAHVGRRRTGRQRATGW